VTRANRIKELTREAVSLLHEGKSEQEVRLRLKEIALRKWAVSINTLSNYVQTAMVKAKAQIEAEAKAA